MAEGGRARFMSHVVVEEITISSGTNSPSAISPDAGHGGCFYNKVQRFSNFTVIMPPALHISSVGEYRLVPPPWACSRYRPSLNAFASWTSPCEIFSRSYCPSIPLWQEEQLLSLHLWGMASEPCITVVMYNHFDIGCLAMKPVQSCLTKVGSSINSTAFQ